VGAAGSTRWDGLSGDDRQGLTRACRRGRTTGAAANHSAVGHRGALAGGKRGRSVHDPSWREGRLPTTSNRVVNYKYDQQMNVPAFDQIAVQG
jgi:hypothetical protein